MLRSRACVSKPEILMLVFLRHKFSPDLVTCDIVVKFAQICSQRHRKNPFPFALCVCIELHNKAQGKMKEINPHMSEKNLRSNVCLYYIVLIFHNLNKS